MTKTLKGAMIAASVASMFVMSGCSNKNMKDKAEDKAMEQGTKAATQAVEAAGEEIKCAGINECKGQGACGGADHDCAGKNECKGKGWVKVSMAECTAKGGTKVEG